MGIATAIGLGMQAGSVYAQGQAEAAEASTQAALANYNARVSELNARAREQRTKFDQIRQQMRGRKVMGTLRARLGASGAMISEGAPLNLLAEQAFELELENALIGYEGMTEAAQLRSQAQFQRAQADIYRKRAGSYRRAGAIGAGATLLGGFGQMYEAGMFEPQSQNYGTYLKQGKHVIYPAH